MAEPNSVLLDVRTKEEWNTIGKPDGEKIGLKTYFLSIQFGNERFLNENFIQEFKNLEEYLRSKQGTEIKKKQ